MSPTSVFIVTAVQYDLHMDTFTQPQMSYFSTPLADTSDDTPLTKQSKANPNRFGFNYAHSLSPGMESNASREAIFKTLTQSTFHHSSRERERKKSTL